MCTCALHLLKSCGCVESLGYFIIPCRVKKLALHSYVQAEKKAACSRSTLTPGAASSRLGCRSISCSCFSGLAQISSNCRMQF